MDERREFAALGPGRYRNFTGWICFGGTDGFVENATFELVDRYVPSPKVPAGPSAIIVPEPERMARKARISDLPYVDWLRGTWLGGTWADGDWAGGEWRGGTWTHGIWRGGHWRGGSWKAGIWMGGEWHGGEWANGTVVEDGHVRHPRKRTVSRRATA